MSQVLLNSKSALVSIFTIALSNFTFNTNAQIVGTDAYVPAISVGIGINGDGGFEGADTVANPNPIGTYPRSNTQYMGFVADPSLSGWATGMYDGDFFTPGTPENGWGFELLDGATDLIRGNNRSGPLLEIPGSITNWQYVGGCYVVTWDGDYVAAPYNFHWKIVYSMNENDLYYNTSVTITNNGTTTLPDMYYYRNLDPDNNITLSGSYTTQNTIVSQPSVSCSKALVSATQSTPDNSYLGLAAVGDDFRVSKGGFSNRDATDIWNGTGGLTGVVGSTTFSDEAISLAYRMQNILPGESRNLKFVVILDASQADNAINNLFYFTFAGSISGPPPLCSPQVDSAIACSGLPLQIELLGSAINDFNWTWSPSSGLDTAAGPVVQAFPDSITTYTITGVPVNPCFTFNITQQIVVGVLDGPELYVTQPGIQCTPFDVNNLVYIDSNGVVGTVVNFYTNPPINASDTTNLFTGGFINPGDSVYIVIADPVLGCIDYEYIDINWSPGFNFTVNAVLPNCTASDGSLGVSGLSGAGTSYTFSWSPGSDTLALHDSIPAGTYTVTITDNLGCVQDSIINLPNQSTLGSNITLNSYAECGLPTGSFDVTGVSGTPSYTYNIGGGPTSSGTFTNLTDGLYVITITDASGCIYFDSIMVPDTSTIAISLDSTTDVFCGTNNGTIAVIGSGGATPYTFSLGGTTQTGTLFDSLSSGSYSIIVTDLGGCKDTLVTTIIDNLSMIASLVDTTSAVCGNTAGAAQVTATNGGFTYTYTLGASSNSTGTFAGLSPGSYTVTVVSGTCSQNVSFTIASIQNLVGVLVDTNEAVCANPNGSVQVQASNGLGTYTYSLPGFGSNATGSFTGLPSGTYSGASAMTITSGTCSVTVPFVVGSDPSNLLVDSISSIDENCGVLNGQIVVQATGGTSPYTYSTGATVQIGNGTFNGLNDGTYNFTVVDVNGCTQNISISIGEIPIIVNLGPDRIFCNSNTLSPGAFGNYVWSTGETTSAITITTSGQYYVTVSTTPACIDSDTLNATVVPSVGISVPNVFTPNGDGKNDVFEITGFEINTYRISIFDRWGINVFSSNNFNDYWNGKFKNENVAEGVYLYVIEYIDPCQTPQEQTLHGAVQVFR